VELKKWEGTLREVVSSRRRTEGAKPGAVKAASPVLNGGDEETGLVRPRLVATQRKVDPDIPCLRCQPVEPVRCPLDIRRTHAYSIGW